MTITQEAPRTRTYAHPLVSKGIVAREATARGIETGPLHRGNGHMTLNGHAVHVFGATNDRHDHQNSRTLPELRERWARDGVRYVACVVQETGTVHLFAAGDVLRWLRAEVTAAEARGCTWMTDHGPNLPHTLHEVLPSAWDTLTA